MKPLRTKGKIHYAVMTSAGDGELFFCKLGRFFCSKKVTEEMGGYQVFDDPDRLWVVAFDGGTSGKAVGFCSFSTGQARDKRIIDLCDSYVDPDWRRQGIYRNLFGFREQEAVRFLPDGGVLKGIALAVSEHIFVEYGYDKRSQRGRFAYMQKEVKKNESV